MEHPASRKTHEQLPSPAFSVKEASGGSFAFETESVFESGERGQVQTHGISYLTDEALFDAVHVRVAFSTRFGGFSQGEYSSLNLGRFVGDDASNVERNMASMLDAAGMRGLEGRLVNPIQVHGTGILDVEETPESRRFDDECDAVSTGLRDVPVMLCYADCVPVVMVAPTGHFCVVHSGWRGTLDCISKKALEHLSAACGCSPSQVNVYIGPHIGQCCYEVDQELAARFSSRFGSACADSQNNLDLEYAVMRALEEAGADRSRAVSAKICTACNTDSFYSHRAEGGNTGRFCALCCRL